MVEQRQLARSKEIHRTTGRTFYVATRFLPERVRHPTYVLYAFFRVVDGDNDLSPEERAERLEQFRRAALGEKSADDPVITAFSEIRERHGIPSESLAAYSASHEQIARLEFDENVAAAVQAELSRAEALYRDSVAGIDCSRRTVSSRCCSRRSSTSTTTG